MAFDGNAFVERFNRVWNAHEIDAILSMMTDAVIFEASTPELGTTHRLEDDYARPDETEQVRRAERASLPD